MKTPQQNIDHINDLLNKIKNHPLCAQFTDDGFYYLVIYPKGFQLDGTRVNYGTGKGIALERLLAAMNRHWDESIIK